MRLPNALRLVKIDSAPRLERLWLEWKFGHLPNLNQAQRATARIEPILAR